MNHRILEEVRACSLLLELVTMSSSGADVCHFQPQVISCHRPLPRHNRLLKISLKVVYVHYKVLEGKSPCRRTSGVAVASSPPKFGNRAPSSNCVAREKNAVPPMFGVVYTWCVQRVQRIPPNDEHGTFPNSVQLPVVHHHSAEAVRAHMPGAMYVHPAKYQLRDTVR